MPTIRINDISDPRISPYRNVRDADLIRDRDSFMAEGRFVLASLIRSTRYPVRSVFLNESAHEQLAELRAELPEDTPVYIASQAVMDEIVGFHIHRGCLAEGDRSVALTPHEVLGLAGEKPVLVLEDLTNHDNVGGIFRSAMALGAGGILVTDRCADPLYRKAIRVSMGAALQLPWAAAPSIDEIVCALKGAGRTIVATALDDRAIDLRDLRSHLTDAPVALLLGAEGPGLSRGAIDASDAIARIETDDRVDSLNVTIAASIALYELTRR